MADFTVQEIVPGAHVALGGVCNRGIIANGGDVLVVDSGISVAEATPLRSAVDGLRTRGSLTLFNTHPHLDHVFGNQLFADQAIVAHYGVRENMIQAGEQTLAAMRQRNAQMAATIGEVTITPPTITFQDRLTLFVGEIEVQLIYFGIAHSPSDSVAWLPQSKTLYTGDLLFNDLVPATPPGANIATWLQALTSLQQLGAEHVIPGHGPIQTPQALNTLQTWFETLRTLVSEAIARGWDRETIIAKIPAEIQGVAPRQNEERLPGTVGLVFDELTRA